MTGHLGKRIYDLLDGRMPPEHAYAAMAHLGECAPCSERWHELRSAREALNSSDVGIDMTFARKLLDKERMAAVAAAEPLQNVRAVRPQSKTPLLASAVAVGVLVIGVGAAYTAGALPHVGLEFASPVHGSPVQTVAYHGPDTMRSPDLLDPWLSPGWSNRLVPVEARVVRGRQDAPVLVVSIVADMHAVVVTEQHGQLAPEVKEELPERLVGDVTVYIANDYPPQMVWESGTVVISASCECPMSVLESVAEAFPVDDQPGFIDRVSAGISEFADAVRGD